MLSLPGIDQVAGATIYVDSEKDYVFYVLPETPMIRYSQSGKPAFEFVKFRRSIDAAATVGERGGGYVQFDCELAVPAARLQAIKQQLQSRVDQLYAAKGRAAPAVEFAAPDWITDADTRVEMLAFEPRPSGAVTHVVASGKPSMIGSNAASFGLFLSELGATVLWQAFQTNPLPLSLQYRLKLMARIPPLQMVIRFDADAAAEHWGDISKPGAQPDQVRGFLQSSGVANVEVVDWQLGADGGAFKQQILEWGWSLIEGVVAVAQAAAGGGDANNVRPHLQDIDMVLKRDSVIPWPVAPQGALQDFLDAPGPTGQKPRREDLYREISLADPIFKRLEVRASCNADFGRDPIAAVRLHIEYGSESEVLTFQDSSTVKTFDALVRPELGERYHYWTEVIFKGASRKMRSEPVESDDRRLVLNLGSLGCLRVQVVAGGINWDHVAQIQVQIRYADPVHAVPAATESVVLAPATREVAYQRIIWAPVGHSYEYKTTHVLKSGRRLESDWIASAAESLIVDDVFADSLVLQVRPVGLGAQLSRLIVEVRYEDAANDYRLSRSFVFTPDRAGQESWVVPVFAGAPRTIEYKTVAIRPDGVSKATAWTSHPGSGVLTAGELVADHLEVQVIPDLLDFNTIRLARVSLAYQDAANGVDLRKDLVFTKDRREPVVWKVPLKDKNKTEYSWRGTFILAGNVRREVAETVTSETALVLEMPA